MPIKKRRPQKSINKNFEKQMRREHQERQMRDAGSLNTRFPSVKRLSIQMEFISAEGHTLSSDRRDFEGNDMLDFSAPCQGRCGNGQMDVAGSVSQTIENHQRSRAIEGICREIIFAGSADTCNCKLRCELAVEYLD